MKNSTYSKSTRQRAIF